MKMVESKEIELFTNACNKMIESKYIMVDKRIADILKSIAECKPVYNLIAECMINFNFDKQFKAAVSGADFLLPEDPKDLVAFVFCMLNCLDDKKININDLLMRFYAKNNNLSSYAQFNNHVILGFRNAVYFLAVGENIEKQEEVLEPAPVVVDKIDSEITNRLNFLVKDLRDYVSGLKKVKCSYLTKFEIIAIIETFLSEIKRGNIYSYKALLLGVKAGAGTDRELLKRISAIDEIVSRILVD